MSVPATQPIADWLAENGLERYAPAFADNDIDVSVLFHLTDADLEKLGVSLGHRRKMLAAIAVLAGAAPASQQPALTESKPQDTAERRQVTVMFSDLVGSTALSARMDPEDLRDVISGYQNCVAQTVQRFGGYVAKYMGDGVLVYFGYPQAHEHDAERAVRAGLELIQAVGGLNSRAQLQTRVGIATGLVVVGDLIGAGSAQEQSVVGETPNLAARLQGIAEPNTAVIAESTRRLLGNLFDLQDLSAQDLKGIASPVRAWAVLRPASIESRFEALHATGLTELVGREEELELLLRRWSKAMSGEGQVVLLSGEAGLGKSRLTAAFLERLAGEPHTRLRYFCSPQHTDSAFYPIVDNFERALQLAREDTREEKLDKLEALVVGQYGRPREDVRFIAAILSIPCEERYGAVPITPQKFKDETLRALVDTVEAIARQQPAVMLFEDAHWADPTTLEVMDLLIQRVRNIPLLVVVTHRPEFALRWVDTANISLSLGKLTRGQSAALVSGLAGKPLPTDLLDQILSKTDGVPLFVEELTKSILESDTLRDAGDHWEYAGHAGVLSIPATLRDSLMARLDRFAPMREVAQIGAAIGREFSYELLASVAARRKPDLDRALAQLVESGLAFEQGTPPAAVYAFKHALVQDAAYDSLLKRRRQQLHGTIARAIEARSPKVAETEPELLAHHYTEAKQLEQAIPLWHKAGAMALKRLALAEAIAHLNKGLDLIAALPPSPARDGMELDLRTSLGTAWIALKGWPAQEVWDSLHPALELANSLRRNDALLPILWGLWVSMLCTGRIAESLRWVTQTLGDAEAYHDPNLWLVGHTAALINNFWLGELVKVREHTDQVLAVYSDERRGDVIGVLAHDPKTQSLAYLAQVVWMLGYPEQAVKIDDGKEAHARCLRHPFDLGWALTVGALVFDHLGEPEEQLKRAEEAERLGREASMPLLADILAPLMAGIALTRKHRFAEGIALAGAALAAWEGVGGRLASPYAKSVLAEAMAQLGNVDGALDLINNAIAQIERPGWEERHYYAEALRTRGCLLSLKGDVAGAERNYIASLDWARQQQAKSWELRAAMSMARLWRDQGKRDEARELLAPVYGWFTEGFDTRDLKEAKALLGELRS